MIHDWTLDVMSVKCQLQPLLNVRQIQIQTKSKALSPKLSKKQIIEIEISKSRIMNELSTSYLINQSYPATIMARNSSWQTIVCSLVLPHWISPAKRAAACEERRLQAAPSPCLIWAVNMLSAQVQLMKPTRAHRRLMTHDPWPMNMSSEFTDLPAFEKFSGCRMLDTSRSPHTHHDCMECLGSNVPGRYWW